MPQFIPEITSLLHHCRFLARQLLRMLVVLPALVAATLLTLVDRRRPQPPVLIGNDLHRPAEVELSVVIPFYNPGASLRPNVLELVSALQQRGIAYEVLAVSDGSTDGSDQTLGGIPGVEVIVAECNRGKGAALHAGFCRARGRYLGMVDADGDIDPTFLCDYLRRAQQDDLEVVYANKYLTGSQSAASSARKLISRGFVAFVTALFNLGVEDTQTGCKLFRRDAMAKVLPVLREQRFAFDLEFFVAAKQAGITRMQAAPVELRERTAGSTVGAKAILRTVREALTIFGRLHLTSLYTTSRATVIALPVAPDDAILQAA